MAEAKFDVESFLKNAVATLRANINTQISAIDTEKGDFVLDPIPSDAWFLNLIPKRFSRDVFVIYGIIEEATDEVIETSVLRKITLQFEIGLNDKNWNESEAAVYRLLRYRRALEETVSLNFRKFGNGKKVKVEGLTPASVSFKGTRFEFSGINISIHLDS